MIPKRPKQVHTKDDNKLMYQKGQRASASRLVVANSMTRRLDLKISPVRHQNGEPVREITRSYSVSHNTISR